MTYLTGQITISSTGIRTYNVGMQPTWIRFRVAQKDGTTETCSHLSLGQTDGDYQYCSSTYTDSTGSTTVNYSTKVVSHRERVGGIISEVMSASFNSFTSTGFRLDVLTANPNYAVIIEFGN